MSKASAMAFVRACRTDAALRERVRELPDTADAAALCGVAEGYAFNDAELAEAFRLDWTARWLHYHWQEH